MSVQAIDDMDDATEWSAVESDGVTPSTQLTIADDTKNYVEGVDGVSALVTAGENASGHELRRTITALDLSSYAELRLSIRVAQPPNLSHKRFLLELRLSSAAMPPDHEDNTWHRLILPSASRRWETLRFSLIDLPDGIATAVTGIQIRCLATPLVVNLDRFIAASPQPLLDCDRAVVAALSGGKIDGNPLTVTVRGPDEDLPDAPGLNVRQVDARYAPQRVIDNPARRDYTRTGYREVHAGTPYDVDYAISAVAETRAQQAALLEAVLDRLPPNGELVIDGESLPTQLVPLSGEDRIGGAIGESPVLVYRIGTRGPARVGPPVPEVTTITVSADLMVTV